MKFFHFPPVLFLVASFGILLAATASALPYKALTDPSNKHNLSSNATHSSFRAASPAGGGTDEICVFCHTPHGASAQSTLWNRPDPGTVTFPLYGADLAIKGNFGSGDALASSQYGTDPDGYPNGSSRMCLSCHDGTTAMIGEVLNAPKDLGTSISMINGTFISVDLSMSHPVSFIYTAQVATDIETDRSVTPIGSAYQVPTVDYVRLDGQSRMQCTTCHDPHDDTSSNPLIQLPFWRHKTALTVSAAYDEVCNACHLAAPTYNNLWHGTKDLP